MRSTSFSRPPRFEGAVGSADWGSVPRTCAVAAVPGERRIERPFSWRKARRPAHPPPLKSQRPTGRSGPYIRAPGTEMGCGCLRDNRPEPALQSRRASAHLPRLLRPAMERLPISTAAGFARLGSPSGGAVGLPTEGVSPLGYCCTSPSSPPGPFLMRPRRRHPVWPSGPSCRP